MPTTERQDPWELLNQAIALLDQQIAELQSRRAGLAALIGQPTTPATTTAPTPSKQRTMSDEAKARISAAAKKRWAQKKKAANAAAKTGATAPAKSAPKAASTASKAKPAPNKAKPTKGKPAPKAAKKATKKAAEVTTAATTSNGETA